MKSRNNRKTFVKLNDKNVIYDKYIYFLIAAITVFYLINNFIWLNFNVYPYGPDEFSHLLIAQNFYNGIISGRIERLLELFKLSTDAIYPPLFHFTAALLCFFLGASSISPLIINLLYLLILLFSVYAIGCKLYDRSVGVLATLLISLYPMVFRYSRFFGLDFAQMSMVCLSICFLIYTEYFSNRKFSVLLGISIGLGMLVKWAFLLFLSGPLACVILQAFLRAKKNLGLCVVFINLLLSLLIGVLISLTWYLPSYAEVLIRLRMFFWSIFPHHCGQLLIQKTPVIFGLDRFFDYFCLLVNGQISLFFFLVFILAVPLFFIKRFNRVFLISWYILPYILLSFSLQKEGRFMLSSLPAIALISAAGLRSLYFPRFNYFLKHLLYAVILFIGLMQFFDVSYNYERKEKTFPFQTPIGIIHMLYFPSTEHNGWAYGPPLRKDWKIDKIAASIAGFSYSHPQAGADILVGVISEDDYVRNVFSFLQVLNYYLAREDHVSSFAVIDFLSYPGKYDWSFINKINDLNYVVFISGIKSWPAFDDLKFTFNKFITRAASLSSLQSYLYNIKHPYDFKNATERLRKFLDSKDRNFSLIDKIKLADGYYAYVYARK